MFRLFGLALLASIAGAATAQAAPTLQIDCPADIRGEITTRLDAEWVATPQSSRVQQAVIGRIGRERVLSCRYRLFGTIYTVHRPFPPNIAVCDARSSPRIGFDCWERR